MLPKNKVNIQYAHVYAPHTLAYSFDMQELREVRSDFTVLTTLSLAFLLI